MTNIQEKKLKIKYFFSGFLKYLILCLGAFLALLPIIVVFIGSFKTNNEFLSSSVFSLPKTWDFSNYKVAFSQGQMGTGFKNTFIILLITMIGKLLLGSAFAYAISRFEFKGKKVIIALFLFAMMIPAVTSQVSVFQIINKVGLYNTIWSVIVLNLGTDIISIYIFLQYLKGISVSLDESAILDGANYFQIFFKIILPNLKAPMITVMIISGVGMYNDFYNPYLYMPDPNLKVISTALFAFKGPYGSQWPIILAGVIIVIVPILIIFLALQKYIYNAVSGSVK
jgi:multiple sugar transport system permease protein